MEEVKTFLRKTRIPALEWGREEFFTLNRVSDAHWFDVRPDSGIFYRASRVGSALRDLSSRAVRLQDPELLSLTLKHVLVFNASSPGCTSLVHIDELLDNAAYYLLQPPNGFLSSYQVIDVLLSFITRNDLCGMVRCSRHSLINNNGCIGRLLAYIMRGKMSKSLRRELSLTIKQNPSLSLISRTRDDKVDYHVVVEQLHEKKGLKVDKRFFMEFLLPKGFKIIL
jgi:hypothetical protein